MLYVLVIRPLGNQLQSSAEALKPAILEKRSKSRSAALLLFL